MACRTRDDVLNLLSTQEFQIFDQCQRGAFNTSCTQQEREALKLVKRALSTAQSLIFMAAQLSDEKDPTQSELNGPPLEVRTVAEILKK